MDITELEQEKDISKLLNFSEIIQKRLTELQPEILPEDANSPAIDTTNPKVLNALICKAIGDNIRKYRIAENISQSKLSRNAQIDQYHECRIETGNVELKATTLIKISVALGIDLNLLCATDINWETFGLIPKPKKTN